MSSQSTKPIGETISNSEMTDPDQVWFSKWQTLNGNKSRAKATVIAREIDGVEPYEVERLFTKFNIDPKSFQSKQNPKSQSQRETSNREAIDAAKADLLSEQQQLQKSKAGVSLNFPYLTANAIPVRKG